MKQYFKPLLLTGSGMGGVDDDDPISGHGSQTGGVNTRSIVNLFSASEDVLSETESPAVEMPIELPMADAAEAAAPLAPAVEPEEIAPPIEIAPVDIG